MELLEVPNLTELKLTYNNVKFDHTTFCNLLRKMPKLENLVMKRSYEYRGPSSEIENEENLKLLSHVAIVAASQNIDIIFQHYQISYDREWTKWKIERKIAESEANLPIRTLNLVIWIDWEHGLVTQLKKFLDNNLQSHHLITLEGVQEV